MKIETKINDALDLDIPKFLVDDNPIGSHLNKYDMLKHLNSYSFTCAVGKPGSGKSSLIVSFLTGKQEKRVFRKCFNHILLVMPEASRNSMQKNIFKNHDQSKMFEDLDGNTIHDIYDQLVASSAEKKNTLLILDDVGASLKSKDIKKMFRKIIFNRRHLRCHIVCMVQSYLSLEKEIRKLITNIFMFKPSKVEFANFCEELFQTKKDEALQIMNYVYTHDHDYLMLNIDSQRMYKDFNELIITQREDDLEDAEKSSK